MSWLSKLVKGGLGKVAGGLFGGLGGAAGSAIASTLFGGMNERNLNRQNSGDIGRQSEFLRGIAPAQKDYLDEVYPGTSPWERLGVSAASPMMQYSGAEQGSARSFLSQLAGQQLQATTAKEVAGIQQKTAEKVAKINQSTELEKANLQTNNGELPRAQTLTQAADTFLKRRQAVTEDYRQNLYSTQAAAQMNEAMLASAKQLFEMMPKETLDFGMYRLEAKRGWEAIKDWLGDRQSDHSILSLREVAESLGPGEWDQLMSDAAKVAGSLSRVTNAAAGVASNIGYVGRHIGKAAQAVKKVSKKAPKTK